MRMLRYAARARRLERMLERHVRELKARRQTLRSSLAEEDPGLRLESEGGFARDARDLGAALLTLSSNTVQAIESALRRLRSGTYGLCADCEERIAAVRLRALPFAETCVACQDQRDASAPAPALA